jgi:hypothetical protein
MIDEWKAGDLALCVTVFGGEFSPNDDPVEVGKIYTVTGIDMRAADPNQLGLFLLEAKAHDDGEYYDSWLSSCFRKIRPDTGACDREEWEAIMNLYKKKIGA